MSCSLPSADVGAAEPGRGFGFGAGRGPWQRSRSAAVLI